MDRKNLYKLVILSLLMAFALIACQSEPEIVEVTRVVTETETIVETVVEEVQVEVTREIEVVQLQEIETEVVVTQIVEVVPEYVPEGTLQIAHSVNHIGWDPHNDQRTISLQYLNPIFEGLLRESNDGQSFIPELATGWEEDESGVTFTLRKGVTFHDGTPFDASVAVANFDRVKAEGHVVNRGFLSNVESAEAIDEFTVRYNYSEFDGTVLLTLSRFAGKMISPATFDTINDNNPVGTGPYVYNAEESNPDNTFKIYDYNSDYWNSNVQPVARIEITTVTDGATMLNGLLTGRIPIQRSSVHCRF